MADSRDAGLQLNEMTSPRDEDLQSHQNGLRVFIELPNVVPENIAVVSSATNSDPSLKIPSKPLQAESMPGSTQGSTQDPIQQVRDEVKVARHNAKVSSCGVYGDFVGFDGLKKLDSKTLADKKAWEKVQEDDVAQRSPKQESDQQSVVETKSSLVAQAVVPLINLKKLEMGSTSEPPLLDRVQSVKNRNSGLKFIERHPSWRPSVDRLSQESILNSIPPPTVVNTAVNSSPVITPQPLFSKSVSVPTLLVSPTQTGKTLSDPPSGDAELTSPANRSMSKSPNFSGNSGNSNTAFSGTTFSGRNSSLPIQNDQTGENNPAASTPCCGIL